MTPHFCTVEYQQWHVNTRRVETIERKVAFYEFKSRLEAEEFIKVNKLDAETYKEQGQELYRVFINPPKGVFTCMEISNGN